MFVWLWVGEVHDDTRGGVALLAIIMACPTKKNTTGVEQLLPREMKQILGISTSYKYEKNILNMSNMLGQELYIKFPIQLAYSFEDETKHKLIQYKF